MSQEPCSWPVGDCAFRTDGTNLLAAKLEFHAALAAREPTLEEINTAIDTLQMDRNELNDRLKVRRVFLDFMRYRMEEAQQELWRSNRGPAA